MDISDIIQLSGIQNADTISENAILQLLLDRFKNDQPYTQLGNSKIIVVNPLKPLELLNNATLEAYGQHGYKDALSHRYGTPEPHVYEMATRVYLLTRRRPENHAILLSGMSGSGKSTTHYHLLKELLYLSTHTRKEEKIQQEILGVHTILRSFGIAASAHNETASCLGQFQVLQFNERGRIIGSSVSIFLLDKHRISRPELQQYDAFYQLVAGTTPDEKQALHMTHQNFHYLNQHRDMQQDGINFEELKLALGVCGFKTKTIAQMCQLLATILHLGNVQFADGSKTPSNANTTLVSNTSIGNNGNNGKESCRIKNKDTLVLVAAALGIAVDRLETALTHKLKLVDNEFCTAFMTKEAAIQQRDALAHTLYTALVLWITSVLNQKMNAALDESKTVRTISILDVTGFHLSITMQHQANFYDLCANYISEQLRAYIFDRQINTNTVTNADYVKDGVWRYAVPSQIKSINPSLEFYHGTNKNRFALIPLLNQESKRLEKYATDATDKRLLSTLFQNKNENQSSSDYIALMDPSAPSSSFVIQHFDCLVDIHYSVDGFLESNIDAISPDFIDLFKHHCTNDFVHDLFDTKALTGWVTDTHSRDKETVTKAQLPIWPGFFKSLDTQHISQELERNKSKRKKKITSITSNTQTVMDQLVYGMERLKKTLNGCKLLEIIHVCPNNMQKSDFFDLDFVGQQIKVLQVSEMATQIAHLDTLLDYTPKQLVLRYQSLIRLPKFDLDELFEDEDEYEQSLIARDWIAQWIKQMQWNDKQIRFGQSRVWLSFDLWRNLENQARSMEKETRLTEKQKVAPPSTIDLDQELNEEEYIAAQREAARIRTNERAMLNDPWYTKIHEDDLMSDMTLEDSYSETATHTDPYYSRRSDWGLDSIKLAEGFGPNLDMSKMMENYSVQADVQVEEVSITGIRRWWSRFVLLMTWWAPSFTLKHLGKMSRQDIQMAWREKVTLCLLIFLFSAAIIFFIVGLSPVVCPGTDTLYTSEDVFTHQAMDNFWISVRGKVYDATSFVSTDHGTPVHMGSKLNMNILAGHDLSYTFPPPLSIACTGLVSDPALSIVPNETIALGPFIHVSGPQQLEAGLDKLKDPYWLNKYFGSTMALYRKGDIVISMKQIKDDFVGWGRLIATIDDRVYDITDYMNTARRYPVDVPGVPNYHFLDPSVEALFTKFGGKDVTAEWNKYSRAMTEEVRRRNKACLDNVFYIGRVDYRDTLRCTFVNYLLLSFAIVMSVVILVKFLAALQFGSSPTPDDHDRFVICQVPCYTEDEDSLRKTIDSLAAMSYDDKHKLLFLIADGMIIGSGNDKPTPRILLDILGHDKEDDSEAFMFKSIGEGSKQLNYGKVYSGLYEYEGHVVPYVVIVKVGKSSEKNKPGNRGKRDSQIICMNFLNKVHFDAEMTPLELEVYYHIKHVIGIDPGLYEYILMVDSDTEVYSDSLNRLVSCMLHDSRIIGLCGETELGNEDRSWITMIQVYEYYISHHLVKSFESLFGSVTCLPGCFCMYRIRTATNHQPLIVSHSVIQAYSDNQVDTLHKKNLLHLGEDRYLTTLMMKNFPQYKMIFTPYAKCKTVAPDKWRVLLSQRRRWINSTIHNLLELILLQELCGFCCLSMRFVVLTDLIGTITLPSSVIYLMYLIYEVISGSGPVPTIALGMLAGAYGLQSFIFILKRQWQHVGWMIIYIIAIPIFSFFIPLYAFWHFDDFSWGNTRVVVGDKKKQIITTDDEKFDESIIPLKKWSVYEQEMWETRTLKSHVTRSSSSVYSYDDLQSTNGSRRYNYSYQKYYPREGSYDGRTLISHPSAITSNPHYTKYPNFVDDESLGFSFDLSSVMRSRTSSRSEFRKESDTPEQRVLVIPENEDIEREIRNILSSENLMTLTKKQVRDQLSTRFGVDLTIKKGFINATIERLLEQYNI